MKTSAVKHFERLALAAVFVIAAFVLWVSFNSAHAADTSWLWPEAGTWTGAVSYQPTSHKTASTSAGAFGAVSATTETGGGEIQVGYYMTRDFELRASVGNGNDVDINLSGTKIYSFNCNYKLGLEGVAYFPVAPKLRAYGLLGGKWNSCDGSNQASPLQVTGQSKDLEYKLGAGVQYLFNRNFIGDVGISHGSGLEYTTTSPVGTTTITTSYTAVMGAIRFNFKGLSGF